jgi:hypothetical protein
MTNRPVKSITPHASPFHADANPSEKSPSNCSFVSSTARPVRSITVVTPRFRFPRRRTIATPSLKLPADVNRSGITTFPSGSTYPQRDWMNGAPSVTAASRSRNGAARTYAPSITTRPVRSM